MASQLKTSGNLVNIGGKWTLLNEVFKGGETKNLSKTKEQYEQFRKEQLNLSFEKESSVILLANSDYCVFKLS